jgi:hypothetical protein
VADSCASEIHGEKNRQTLTLDTAYFLIMAGGSIIKTLLVLVFHATIYSVFCHLLCSVKVVRNGMIYGNISQHQ